MKRKLIILTLVVGVNISSSVGQNKFLSPGQEHTVQALGIGPSIDHHTGVVNISIPICTAKSRHLSLPVSINYNTSGLKVSDYASCVGLGWSLQTGGIITRNRRGTPDEIEQFTDGGCLSGECGGYFYTGRYMYSYVGETEDWFENVDATESYVKEDALNELFDTQPDLFTFNCGAGQGDFVFKIGKVGTPSEGDIEFHPIEHTNIKVSYTTDGYGIDSWTLIGEDGTIYEFTASEKRWDFQTCEGIDQTPDLWSNYRSSWKLSKIKSANGKDSISIDYYNGVTEDFGRTTSEYRIDSIDSCNPIDTIKCTNYQSCIYYGTQIKEISTPLYNIKFSYGSYREDRWSGGFILDSITIRYKDDELYKKHNFYYSYFTSDYESGTSDAHLGYEHTYLEKRLRLDSIIISNGNEESLPPYKFDYYYDSSDDYLCLPPQNSTKQDYLGYYNGINNGATLVPNATYEKVGDDCEFTSDADRSIDTLYTKANMLKKIINPTGSYTELEYQAHRYLYIQAGNSLVTEKLSGGLRIFKIKSKDNDGNELIKQFEYEGGRLTFKEPTHCYVNEDYQIKRSSENMTTRGIIEGYHIGYDHVTVKNIDSDGDDNGYTKYTFGGQGSCMYDNDDDYDKDKYPFPPRNSFNWLRGKLEYLTVKDQSNNTVSYTDYTNMNLCPVTFGGVLGCVVYEKVPGVDQYGDPLDPEIFTDATYFITTFGRNSLTSIASSGDASILNNVDYNYNVAYRFYSGKDNDDYNLEEKVYYVSDYSTGVYAKMKERNMLTPIYKTYSVKNTDTINGRILDYNYYTFNSNQDTLILPEDVSEWDGEKYEQVSAYHDYDVYGNMLQYMDKSKVYHSTVWGYKNSLPLANIINAKYEDVKDTLENEILPNYTGISTIDDLNDVTNESTLRDIFDDLRDELPEALIVSYTYDELMGKTSECDANKITIHYVYDNWGRISEIKDDDENILQRKEYNIVSQ